MHSKISIQFLEDSRINTLIEIRNWFIHGDKQKTESKEWISLQCQFDLILSINGFLGMIDFFKKISKFNDSTKTHFTRYA